MRSGTTGLHKHTQLTLETPQNPGDQSRISLMFAESTLSGEKKKKKKLLQYAALEKSLPQQPAQLGAPAHICVPSCLRSVAAREAQPRASTEHRDTTGSSWGSAGAPGAGTEWRWQKKPHCWERERLLAERELGSLREICVNMAQVSGEQSPGALLYPSSGHPWNLPRWKGPTGITRSNS